MDRVAPRISEQRVHIVPLGYEFDRIIQPIKARDADIVYLLVDDENRSESESGSVELNADWSSADSEPADWSNTTDYQREVREELTEITSVRSVPVRLTDVYDVMGVATTVASHHGAGSPEGDRVFVNISTGPHVTAVGVAMACMAVGARPYSVEPETRAHDVEATPLSTGMKELIDLPIYPIRAPTRDQVAILEFLAERETEGKTTSKRTLIEYAEREDLEFLDDSDAESMNPKYRHLERKILNDLEGQGHVDVADHGRTKRVTITRTGRQVYIAFKHLIE